MISVRLKSGAFALFCLIAHCAFAQEKPAQKRDELDVTMQIIVNPDTKLPDEIVRRIPLPARKPVEGDASKTNNDITTPDVAANKGQERAKEAQALGREMAERAKERAQDAAEQRAQAQHSAADERRQNPPTPPGRPSTTPGR